jgi:hypothetical protein
MEELPSAGGAPAGNKPTDPLGNPPPPAPTTQPLFGSNLMRVRTAAELSKIAGNQVDAEISAAVSPLSAEVGTLGSRETRAVKGIQDMFGSILPYAQKSAEGVQTSYDAAEAAQQSIFETANARMNQLKQSRAQEAQALAQEIGGPVSVGEFTSSMGYEPEALASLGAGQQLHTLQFGLADVGQSQAFAGRVLPLMSTEQQSQAKQYYEDQITEINKQIADLKSQRGTKVNAKMNELLTQERTYQLQKTQQNLDRLKANRDWIATKQTLKNDDKRTTAAINDYKLREGQLTGTYKGKPTLEARQLTAQEKLDAKKLGLDKKQYLAQIGQFRKQYNLDQAKLKSANRVTWAQWLDAAVKPTPGQAITTTRQVPASRTTDGALPVMVKGKDGKLHPTSPPQYYKLVTVTTAAPAHAAVTEPNRLVDFLVAHQVPKTVAVNMVKARFHIPSWGYGKRDPRLPAENLGPPAPGKTEAGPNPPTTEQLPPEEQTPGAR